MMEVEIAMLSEIKPDTEHPNIECSHIFVDWKFKMIEPPANIESRMMVNRGWKGSGKPRGVGMANGHQKK